MQTRRFGRTNHQTSLLVYGAAALGDVSQETADESLAYARSIGINHFDTAASYGRAEELMGPSMPAMRADIFLGTKTTERTEEAAWKEIVRSFELLETDHIDLLQVHAVCDMDDLEKVFAKGGPLPAFERARDEGMADFIGITGHTEAAPSAHAEALRRFDFDSVLCPMNYQLWHDTQFREGFIELSELIEARDVGLRTIKAIARRPRLENEQKYATWYLPFEEQDHITAAISWVLGKFPQIAGLATAGEVTLLPHANEAVNNLISVEDAEAILAEVDDYATIFV